MALEHKDRVSDTSNTTGTGTLTLTGIAPAGRRTFASAHTTGATIHYTVQSEDGTQWEVGEGVWTSSGSTLTRVTVFASSNAGALVNFTGTPLTVISTLTAADATFDKAKVSRSTNVTLSISTWVPLPMTTTNYDTNVIVNGSYQIVAKKAGYYQYHVRSALSAARILVVGVGVNGTFVENGGFDTVSQTQNATSGMVYLNSGDYIEPFIYVGSGYTITEAAFSVVGPF